MARFNFHPVNVATHDRRRRASGILLIACTLALPGCTVLAVADLAASAVVGTAGLVVDAAVGTVKIGGKVIGKTADVVFGSEPAPAP
jgi:cobalamin biosynthesis protein CobD/CbiB